MIKDPIFIVCSASSGSTLLSNILDNHYDIAIGPELYLLNKDLLFNNFNNFKKNIKRYLNNGLPTYGQSKANNLFLNMKAYYLNEQIIISFIQKSSTPKNFIDLVFNYYIEKRNKKQWGEKTGSNAYNLDYLLKIYPNAKIIHLVRDPYDTISSIKRRGVTPFYAISHYLYNNIAALRYKDHKNYYRIYYESLVNKPEEEIVNLCKFLDIEYNPDMLSLENSYWNNIVDKNLNTHNSWNNSIYDNSISTTSIGKGKNSITHKDKYIIEKICLSKYAINLLNLKNDKIYDFHFLLSQLNYNNYNTSKKDYKRYLLKELYGDYFYKLLTTMIKRHLFIKPLISLKK